MNEIERTRFAFQRYWEYTNLDRIRELSIEERGALIDYHWRQFLTAFRETADPPGAETVESSS